MRYTFVVILLLVSILAPRLHAAPPELSAEEPLVFDAQDQSLVARGNAVFVHDDFRVEADEIRYFRTANRAEARGNVKVTRAGFRLVTDELIYNVDSRAFSAGAFRAGYPPLFAEGDQLAGTADELELGGVTLYLGEPKPVSPKVNAERVVLRPGERIIAINARPGVGDFSLFRIPEISRPIDAPGVEIGGQVGYKGDLGAFIRGRALIPLNENFYAGAELDIMSRRGVLIGPAVEFDYDSGDTTIDASLRGGWIADQNNPDYDYSLREIPDDRWYAQLSYQQITNDRLFVTADLNQLSDSEFFRDFRESYFDGGHYPDNFVETTYQWDNVILSALTRFETGGEYAMTERLPGVQLDLLSTPIGAGIYHTGFISAERLRERVYLEGPGTADMPRQPQPLHSVQDGLTAGTEQSQGGIQNSSAIFNNDFIWVPSIVPLAAPLLVDPYEETHFDYERIHAYYGFKRPVHLADWLTLTPSVGGLFAWYSDAAQIGSPVTRNGRDLVFDAETAKHYVGQLGIDLQATFHKDWDYQNETWGIRGLRHLLRPVAYWRYYGVDGDTDKIVPSVLTGIDAAMPPIDLRYHRSNTNTLLMEPHFVRFGIENLLQTQNDSGGARSLIDLNLYQDVDLAEGELGLAYSQILLHPAPFISVGLENAYETDSMKLYWNRLKIGLKSANLWEAAFYASYLDGYFHHYETEVWYRLNTDWTVGVGLGFDAQAGEFDRQALSVLQRIGDIWELEYRIRHRTDSRRQDDWSISISFRLVQF